MGLFIPGRKAAPRRFSYVPRYYDPSRDESLRRRMRTRSRSRRRRSPIALFYFVGLLLFAIYIYSVL